MFSYSIDTSVEMYVKHDIPTGIGTEILNSESDDTNSLFLASCIYVSNISVLQFSHMKRSVNEIRCYHMSLHFWHSLQQFFCANFSSVSTWCEFSSHKVSVHKKHSSITSFHFRVYFGSIRSLKYL